MEGMDGSGDEIGRRDFLDNKGISPWLAIHNNLIIDSI
jgi:hypothetical protein